MFKPTPNPPPADDVSTYESPSSKKLHEAADRARDHYLNPPKDPAPPRNPSTMFVIAPDINTETLLAHACESLASASIMTSDLAGFLESPHRNALLGIAQIIMLGELAVNRALDNLDPQE
ncbi:DUF6124 family protein [Pseudomonas sp. GM48]|uniref:DUF6124 family protein n=1 Tax=Pseudomonas sp. GM48 TaxID=1144330 RepID=UPI00026FE6AB|nr:DUF6124 family protein [Pseudomonas sp. GM48]EJM51300.1 hypothetical protein PMI28_04966 [Pseudomonas sp. GM48]